MDALRFDRAEQVLSLIKAPIPKIECPNQVLIKVKASGVCGTDLHAIKGEFAIKKERVIMGHEFSGEIVDMGSKAAEKFEKGTRVGIDPNSYCYSCQFCDKGLLNHCMSGGARSTRGLQCDGGFAEYALVPAEVCYPLPKTVTYEEGMLCEPLSCILHGWDRLNKFGPPQPDSKILVLGAGIIGNLWTCMFHYHGYKNVTITEPMSARRDIAKKLTADMGYKVMSPEEAEASLPQTEHGIQVNGIDVAVDCTGTARGFEQALKWMRRGGLICVFGCTPIGEKAKLCPEEIFAKELVIFGTQINPQTYSRTTSLVAGMGSRYLALDKLGVEVFKIQDYQAALKKLEQGTISKAMFNL